MNNEFVICDFETLKEFYRNNEFDYQKDVLNWETSLNYKGRRVWLMSLFNQNTEIVLDVYDNQKTIIDTLLEYKLIYFHNLSYDGNFIIKLCQKLGLSEFNQTEYRAKKLTYEIQMLGSKIYSISFFKGNKKVTQIRDSFNFLRYKVAKLPKLYQLEGLEKTWKGRGYDEEFMYNAALFHKYSNDYYEFKKYCLNDSVIVFYAMMKLINFVIENNLGIENFFNSGTLSSFAFSVYKTLNPSDVQYLTLGMNNFINKDEYLAFRTLYKGGFCDVNQTYQNKVYDGDISITSYDINSAYPTVLKQKLLPCSFKKQRGLKYVTTVYCLIASTDIVAKTNLRFIFKDEYKGASNETHPSVFHVGSIFYLFKEEKAYFDKYYSGDYVIAKEFKLYGKQFDQGGYVDLFYRLKKEYRKVGNEGFTNISKLFLNAVTGKFGQRPNFKNHVIFCDEPNAILYKFDFKTHQTSKEIISVNDSNDDSFYVDKKYRDEADLDFSEMNNFLLIAYITMSTRTLIYKFIEKIGISNWLYSDTDSLKSLVKLNDDKLIGPELGQFKDEGTTSRACFYHPKAYYWENHFTFGGLDLDVANTTLDYKKLYTGYTIKNGKTRPENVLDGLEIVNTDYVIGEV